MANPFIGEIRLMSFSFAPQGWALCAGQMMPISQNTALFSLLGTTYGGNGQTTFALPDMRGRIPMHRDNSFALGQKGGELNHTLSISELPRHVHVAAADAAAGHATAYDPTGALPATTSPTQIYSTGKAGARLVPMYAAMVSNVGGSQPHQNTQPYLTVSFCIALQGLYPTQN